jgi:predicted transcriptional regulator
MSDLRDPTPAELAILNVLWQRGPSTVREVHTELSKTSAMVYTTALKTMQIMADKGLVARDTSQRSHIYTPVHEETTVQGSLVSNLAARAFGGSTPQLAMRALAAGPVAPDDLQRLRDLLERLEPRDEEP